MKARKEASRRKKEEEMTKATRVEEFEACVARKDYAGAAAWEAELSIVDKRRKLDECEQKEKAQEAKCAQDIEHCRSRKDDAGAPATLPGEEVCTPPRCKVERRVTATGQAG